MLQISAYSALWFAPFVIPICLHVAFTDMRSMRIQNQAVVALFAVYLVIGLIALPFESYLWGYLYIVIAMIAGIALNAGGAMGAGDAKFIAVAVPFIHLGDFRFLLGLFAANILAAFVTHRLGKHTFMRRLAPAWESWETGSKFPMGLALGSTLGLYLLMGVFFGS